MSDEKGKLQIKLSDDKSQSHQNISNTAIRKRKPNPEMEDLMTFKQDIGKQLDGIKLNQDVQTQKLQDSIDALNVQNKEILKTNSNIEKILLNTEILYKDLKRKVNKLEGGHGEVLVKINALEEQLEDMQRAQRVSTLEIRNLPELDNENLNEILQNLHTSLEVSVTSEQIKQIRRIKASKNKVVIVEYLDSRVSSSVLRAMKSYNKTHKEDKFNTVCLNLPGKKTPIYISESLTPTGRKLHFLARELRKYHGYKHCWTSMGRVFVKYADGTPPIQIKSALQVEALKKPDDTEESAFDGDQVPAPRDDSSGEEEEEASNASEM